VDRTAVSGPSSLRSFLLLVLFLVVQSTVALDIRVAGAHPDLMLLLPITYGLVAGPVGGALCGFCVGIAADLLLPTPFGLSALVDCVLGFAAGWVPLPSDGGEGGGWLLTTVVVLAGSAAGAVGYPLLGAVLGQPEMVHVDLVAVVIVVAVPNAILAVPALAVTRWALGIDRRRRRRTIGPVPAGGRVDRGGW